MWTAARAGEYADQQHTNLDFSYNNNNINNNYIAVVRVYRDGRDRAAAAAPPFLPPTNQIIVHNMLLRCEITVVASLCTCGGRRVASRSRGPGLGAHANDTAYTARMVHAASTIIYYIIL
uniref:Uncharacterized protein n=1 Tax=Schizaphis graminum TaxID=13262 RepID=A0A2S2PV49_SCHGA